jgi:hypothetical protein
LGQEATSDGTSSAEELCGVKSSAREVLDVRQGEKKEDDT